MTIEPYLSDVAVAGPDAPKCERIDDLIRLLVTIRHRWGNTAIKYRVTWGGSALWAEDELRGVIRKLWDWQKTTQELLPDGMAEEIKAALGEEPAS